MVMTPTLVINEKSEFALTPFPGNLFIKVITVQCQGHIKVKQQTMFFSVVCAFMIYVLLGWCVFNIGALMCI